MEFARLPKKTQKLYAYLTFPCFNVSKVHPQGSCGVLKVTLKSPLDSEWDLPTRKSISCINYHSRKKSYSDGTIFRIHESKVVRPWIDHQPEVASLFETYRCTPDEQKAKLWEVCSSSKIIELWLEERKLTFTFSVSWSRLICLCFRSFEIRNKTKPFVSFFPDHRAF